MTVFSFYFCGICDSLHPKLQLFNRKTIFGKTPLNNVPVGVHLNEKWRLELYLILPFSLQNSTLFRGHFHKVHSILTALTKGKILSRKTSGLTFCLFHCNTCTLLCMRIVNTVTILQLKHHHDIYRDVDTGSYPIATGVVPGE